MSESHMWPQETLMYEGVLSHARPMPLQRTGWQVAAVTLRPGVGKATTRVKGPVRDQEVRLEFAGPSGMMWPASTCTGAGSDRPACAKQRSHPGQDPDQSGQ